MDAEPILMGQPTPGKRMEELHVWIAINRDGDEGIVSSDMVGPNGLSHMPLMSSKREVAEQLRGRAEWARDTSIRQGTFIEVELRTYVRKS